MPTAAIGWPMDVIDVIHVLDLKGAIGVGVMGIGVTAVVDLVGVGAIDVCVAGVGVVFVVVALVGMSSVLVS